MSDNYIRKCAVYIEALGQTFDAEMTSIRCRFTIRAANMDTTNTATIKLTNQNRDHAKQLCQVKSEGTFVSIDAGYLDNCGVIFKGHIVRCIFGRENPTDTMTQILCSDGDQGHNFATINQTVPAGSTPKTLVDAAMKELKKYAITPGFIGQNVDLSKPVFPRPVALFGMAYKVLTDVARTKRAVVSTQNLKMQMLTSSDYIPGSMWELNSETGLVGMPTLTIDGVYARTLINPQCKMNQMVHINQALIQGYLPPLDNTGAVDPSQEDRPSIAADGNYRIVKIDVEADTRGEPWYMDILCIKPGDYSDVSLNTVGYNH